MSALTTPFTSLAKVSVDTTLAWLKILSGGAYIQPRPRIRRRDATSVMWTEYTTASDSAFVMHTPQTLDEALKIHCR
eukprot:CAMPEP_0119411924 /NCGR_PEP_ID=MMETSP1335-20130426/4514_1 /TAXON_ID=259385 /ORGANISM="Chrysoculter rhomboideus, Strain RCC1486" /LENGTH=76 /DNA_ID=CAMNT_0007436609 /DNA_START=29 /DNA_END=259 /DNA_ORIENTATION=+